MSRLVVIAVLVVASCLASCIPQSSGPTQSAQPAEPEPEPTKEVPRVRYDAPYRFAEMPAGWAQVVEGKGVTARYPATGPIQVISSWMWVEARGPRETLAERYLAGLFKTAHLGTTEFALDGVPGVQVETEATFGKPSVFLGHARRLARCINTVRGGFCVMCSQYEPMKSVTEIAEWNDVHKAGCEAVFLQVVLTHQ